MWIHHSLTQYTSSANVCNLDAHHSCVHGDSGSLWMRAHDAREDRKEDASIAKKLLEKLRWVTLGLVIDSEIAGHSHIA